MKKLYALITHPDLNNSRPRVIQVSFDKEELEKIANYLNKFPYFSPNATVKEVDEHICDWYWPR